jgi:hypothetical protein
MSESELKNHIGSVVDDDDDDTIEIVALGTGITDEERRHLRKRQRALQERVVAERRTRRYDNRNSTNNNDLITYQDALDKVRAENNGLFRKVRYTREAVFDIENVQLIASLAVRIVQHRQDQVRPHIMYTLLRAAISSQSRPRFVRSGWSLYSFFNKMANILMPHPFLIALVYIIPFCRQIQRYDVDRIVTKLKSTYQVASCEMSYFHWKRFGADACSCFSRATPVGISFLKGWLDATEEGIPIRGRHISRMNRRRRTKKQPTRTLAAAVTTTAITDNGIEVGDGEHPEEVVTTGHNMNRDVDQLSAVERNLQDVHTALCEKVKANLKVQKRNLKEFYGKVESIPKNINKAWKKNSDVCAVNLLVNPKSL